jgi:predicted Abi (CAAX) family protease
MSAAEQRSAENNAKYLKLYESQVQERQLAIKSLAIHDLIKQAQDDSNSCPDNLSAQLTRVLMQVMRQRIIFRRPALAMQTEFALHEAAALYQDSIEVQQLADSSPEYKTWLKHCKESRQNRIVQLRKLQSHFSLYQVKASSETIQQWINQSKTQSYRHKMERRKQQLISILDEWAKKAAPFGLNKEFLKTMQLELNFQLLPALRQRQQQVTHNVASTATASTPQNSDSITDASIESDSTSQTGSTALASSHAAHSSNIEISCCLRRSIL